MLAADDAPRRADGDGGAERDPGLRRLPRTDPTCRFTTLIDITAVDWPARERRFDVVYHFLSMHLNQRIRVKAEVREDELVPSIIGEFPVAPTGTSARSSTCTGSCSPGIPDLRRILTDYGFRGHPLRKDFPTTGYVELRYDEEQKRVVYEPVKLTQEYRLFDFMSPWEGAEYILPGDEKKGARWRVDGMRRGRARCRGAGGGEAYCVALHDCDAACSRAVRAGGACSTPRRAARSSDLPRDAWLGRGSPRASGRRRAAAPTPASRCRGRVGAGDGVVAGARSRWARGASPTI